jgi:hypothetical protein
MFAMAPAVIIFVVVVVITIKRRISTAVDCRLLTVSTTLYFKVPSDRPLCTTLYINLSGVL